MRCPRSLVLTAVAAMLFSATVSAWAGDVATTETTRTSVVRTIDRKIRDAEHHIRTWNRRFARWQVRIGRAAVAVERLTQRAERGSAISVPVAVLDPRTPRPALLSYRVDHAHRALRQMLHDPEGRNAQQQLDAWGAYLSELQQARDTLIRQQRHAARASRIVPGEPITYEAWARGFLSHLDAPSCDENLTIVVTWETAESTDAAFNPLATTHAIDGATDFNIVGVKNYVSLEQGLDASRDTLEGGADSFGYGAIVDSLRECAPAETTAAAINASAWCRGCGGGAYIIGLLPIVRADYAGHAERLISTRSA